MSNTPRTTPDHKESTESYRQLIASTGENLDRPGLLDTPVRAAKAFSHLTQGYHQSIEEVVNNAVFPSANRELVLVQNIEFYSLCEHHMLPFHGVAHIGYLPDGQVLGLSKFARIVDMFARRLQIQENLSEQIAQTIMDVTGCRGVAVVMDAAHMCMMMRGVSKQHSTTRSTAMLGEYQHNNQARNEFLGAVPKRQPAF
ncbi:MULTISPECIES: GTP cyclohydrolase I FolE [unclassified Psychrobacter]|uniref:GTP cyclohydrolase I FolE n=1 Tax=unclassified Psychrobacter TaxID=196806 RepID=UPI0025B3F990|nr:MULTISPECIES: GTP cyclohydrolase I FolE [unclassified Psychrobacter]MDN3451910.1 GTP cyclohydrolase I FolE [Psychrobacter sp. APC 3350]MDN3501866.1 GTP cyclohydrolase I FolE [Psychrobacter sp. 5A.1]